MRGRRPMMVLRQLRASQFLARNPFVVAQHAPALHDAPFSAFYAQDLGGIDEILPARGLDCRRG